MRERTLLSTEVLDQLPNLSHYYQRSAQCSIDLDACKERGIVVSGTASPGCATAELAMTLIGVLARQIVLSANAMANGGWQVATGQDLRGARLGILGLGRLGSRVAKLGQAYGMEVQAWSQNLTRNAQKKKGLRQKNRPFCGSDFISIHLKLSDRVIGLVGADELSWMQSDACIVNTSRAPIIDEAALIKALSTGKLGGAALDVYHREPLATDDPLRQTQTLSSPRILAMSRARQWRCFMARLWKVWKPIWQAHLSGCCNSGFLAMNSFVRITGLPEKIKDFIGIGSTTPSGLLL